MGRHHYTCSSKSKIIIIIHNINVFNLFIFQLKNKNLCSQLTNRSGLLPKGKIPSCHTKNIYVNQLRKMCVTLMTFDRQAFIAKNQIYGVLLCLGLL